MTAVIPIYLDYAATTPVDPRVAEVMAECLAADIGNPASTHGLGRQASARVEEARNQIARFLGADAQEIVWTSGATESNNLALKGALGFNSAKQGHLVTARTEHKSVIDTARWLEGAGHRVTWLPIDSGGRVDLDQLEALLANTSPAVTLVSLMWVNNETGLIQDIPSIAAKTRTAGIPLHVDASQALGRVAIDLSEVPVDLLSFSGHKIGGPAGIGGLFVRRQPRARIAAQMHGGGHERGLRSGTLAMHQCVGLGSACELLEDWPEEQLRLAKLRDQLWQGLSALPNVVRNGDSENTAAAFLNCSFAGIDGESLLAEISFGEQPLAVSSGSACTAATQEPSYVLRSLGRDDALARASLRFSLGRNTTAAEIALTIQTVTHVVNRLRAMSPVSESSVSRSHSSRRNRAVA